MTKSSLIGKRTAAKKNVLVVSKSKGRTLATAKKAVRKKPADAKEVRLTLGLGFSVVTSTI